MTTAEAVAAADAALNSHDEAMILNSLQQLSKILGRVDAFTHVEQAGLLPRVVALLDHPR